jgi:hypothetical protein
MAGFDDLVASAKKERGADRDRQEHARLRAQEQADRAIAEAAELGVRAASHLNEGQVPTVPIIEFRGGLLGRPKVAELGRAWQLQSGLLGTDGTFLNDRAVTAKDAVSADPSELAERNLRALKKIGLSEGDYVVIGPAKPALHIDVTTASTHPAAYLWRNGLDYLPVNDDELSMSFRHNEDRRPERLAEMLAREVAALTDDRS